ncbi:MAG: NHLP bacteriocin export ABC transporter permease/ATPase subunit [Selenomonas sp.]|nr:NHLP bacteriocin export ABC transporter permease/ATPase subunit [Selenomonas sp.]
MQQDETQAFPPNENAEEARFAKRLKARERNKKLLLDRAMENLLGSEFPKVGQETADVSKLDATTFVVSTIAKALDMPTENIGLLPRIADKLDQLGLIRRLVQKANMQMRLIELVKDWHRKDSGAMIGFYGEDNELVAILPQKEGAYKLVSATNKGGIEVNDEVAAKVNKRAFACYAGFPRCQMTMRDLFSFMAKHCWKHDWKTVLFVSFMAGMIPTITPTVTETIFQDIIPILDNKGLATVTQVSLVASFTLVALSLVRSVAMLRITTHIDMATEAALWGRVLSFPTKFFRQFTTGELSQRMAGLDAVKSMVNEQFVATTLNFLFSFWSILQMAYYSLKLTAAALAVWAVYLAVMLLVYRRVGSLQARLIEAHNATAGMVQQIFSGLAKFRTQGAEEQAYFLWSKSFGQEWRWNLKLRWKYNITSIIGSLQPLLLSLILYYVVFYVVNQGSEGIGYAQFLAFEAAFTAFNATVNAFIPLMGEIFAIRPYMDNLRPVLETMPEISEDRVDADVLTGAIEVRHLTFSYDESKADVIHDVSFQIAAGENVAIVGKSGCGKSTLIRLLLGFEEPRQGAVYYDGQDLSDLSLPSVRSQMGVVLQNGQLMTGDIFTNIVGTTALTMDDAWAAAEAVGIADDIRKMPMGMQTVISEGSSNISGGQRQRILIARALAARPSIIVFDEATSALDNRTQAIVTESLRRMNATRIVVAHRLSTIKDCDRILVLDGGRLAESGNFDELVSQGGIFSSMVKRQIA